MLKKSSAINSKESLKDNRKIVAFVPVRGGSKSIPHKNIKSFCGKPLVYWVLKACNESEEIQEIYVATDDSEIRDVVNKMSFNNVKVISRSAETSTDEASTESVMLEFSQQYDFDDIVLVQATSPLLKTEDLSNGIQKYLQEQSDSLVSVVRQSRFLWEQTVEGAKPINYTPQKRPRRQEWDGFLVENGAFYITSKRSLLESKCRLSGQVSLYEMPEDTYFEIDEEADWLIVEKLKERQVLSSNFEEINFKKINLLISDVDGVLTDAGMYYSSSGKEFKKFNTRDGKGLELLRAEGIKVMFLTSEDINLVQKRAEKLSIDYLHMGVKDKKAFLEDFFHEHKEYSFQTTAYIGDDVNDLECIKVAAFSATPFDGLPSVKNSAKYICSLKGGDGCVREICDFLINRRKNG